MEKGTHTSPNQSIMIPAIATFAKPVVDTFITPKLQELSKAGNSYILQYKHDYIEHQFVDYVKKSYVKNSTINTIAFNNQQRRLSDLYIPLTIANEEDNVSFTIDDSQYDFLHKYEKILITDTAGMGKSTIVKKMFLSILERQTGVPVIIELRRIRKDKDIIADIIEQLSPINKDINKNFVLDLIVRGDFIFFFDGFDEIASDDIDYVSSNLTQFIDNARNNIFVVTSRPEPALAAFGSFKSFKINPLEKEESFALLKKYDVSGLLSDSLIQKVEENINSLDECLTNPLLVSLLYTAFEHKQTIPLKKSAFYRQVFDALFELHDLSKGESFNRDKIRSCKKLSSDDYHQVLRAVAFLCMRNQLKMEYSKDEIISLIREAKVFCTGLEFNESDFLKDVTKSAPLFIQDGIYYKWTHKSLMEYFIAQFISIDSEEHKPRYLNMLWSEYYDKFDNILDIYLSIDPKGFRDVLLYNLLNSYVQFCNEQKAVDDVEEKDLLLRRTFLFLYDVVIFNDDCIHNLQEPKYENEIISKIFSYGEPYKAADKKGWLFPSASVNKYKEDSMAILFRYTKNYYFVNFLASEDHNNGYDFIGNIKQEKVGSVNLPFANNYGVMMNSNGDEIFNKSLYFLEINKLLIRSLPSWIFLKKEESERYINRIEIERKSENGFFF